MKKIVKYFGLDVHKNSISIAIAEEGQKGELTFAAIGAGADAFLCKPFNIKELFSIVDKFVVGEDAGNNGEVSSPVSAY